MQLVASLLNRLPQPLRDRLIAWRVRYPNTPLTDLPPAVQEEVTQILASSLPESAPAPLPQLPQTGVITPATQTTLETLTTLIGTDVTTGLDVRLPHRATRQGTYILGENGTGKTTLVENIIVLNIQDGLGVCVIEPHGDLTHNVLARIPRCRQNDMVYADIEDFEHPFGLSLFEVPEPRTIRTEAAVASFVSHVFETIWHSGFETPRLMQNLRAAARTLIANPGSTFADIPLLYANQDYRARMLTSVRNPQVLAFWEEYERMNFRDRRLFSESFLNKVTAFLDEPMIQHILCQSKTTIDFRSIMDNSKILLIKLSPQFEEASKLIGSIVIGKLLMTAFSRADVRPEERRDFHLYVDEFQRFQSSDFATFISEARKFKIHTFLSHQQLTQLTEQTRASALAAGSIICFRVSGDDSRVVCRSFDTTPTQTIIGEEPVRAPVADVVSHLLRHGSGHSVLQQFVADYLLPLDTLLKQVSSSNHPFAFGCAIVRPDLLIAGQRTLNAVLSACQRQGTAAITVPPIALFALAGAADRQSTYIFAVYLDRSPFNGWEVEGFDESASVFGRPDFLEPKYAQKARALLSKVARSSMWDRRSTIEERVNAYVRMHMSLRATMEVLATAPLMIDTGLYQPKFQMRTYADMEGEISNYLANQENYVAKVKIVNSGEYIIRTHPAPEGLTGDALAERIEAVKRHCRTLGYTRPYTEVIEELRKRQEFLRDPGEPPSAPAPDDGDDPEEPPESGFSLD